jgi:type IV pilus assembly protein PilM
MALPTDAVWAIDLGNNSLKALHLTVAGGILQVIGFDNIQHGKILSGSGIKASERDELIALSLRQFLQRNELGEDEIIISVPSQNSFARFVNLPPVEPKRIPEIVKFEAVQQIPFDINDVQWDWQLMTEKDSAEKKVAIFAIKNEVVNSALEHFSREDLQVSYVQMAPMALYNYLVYDRPDMVGSDNKATVILNIGAENTDLVVCTESVVWQRCILIGGNAFTRAIADTFKLSFEKAEKLKRTAPMSKYARQIFQAMRPVFTDLASEIQRSLGFYTSSNPNTKFSRVVAMGGATKLRGLLKYLQQTLQIPVERPDTFKALAMGSGLSTAKFHENVSDFGVVYGLALQALGLARIESNLLPRSIARSMAWAGKSRYFIGAACLLLLASLMCLGRNALDKVIYARNSEFRQQISRVISEANEVSVNVSKLGTQSSAYEEKIKKALKPFEHRDVVPELHQTVLSALPNAKSNPEQKELYEAFAKGDVDVISEIPRKERKQVFVTEMSAYFSDDLAKAKFGATATMRRGTMTMPGEEDMGSSEEYMAMMEQYGMMGDRGEASAYMPDFLAGTVAKEEKKRGFVVSIVGYSPYKKIGELLDPPGVDSQPSKWGVVTRLLHLDDMVADGNSPFELYKRTDVNHFELRYEPVDLQAGLPSGIGVVEVRYTDTKQQGMGMGSGTQILLDPMTKEIIGKVPVLNEYGEPKLDRDGKPVYEDNDHWFVLNAKFVWTDAPALPERVTATSPYTQSRPRPAAVSTTTGETKQRTGGRTTIKGFEDY